MDHTVVTKKKTAPIALVWIVFLLALTSRGAEPIRVMIVDGESGGPYHKWQLTTPVLKKELDETGLFQVDIVTAPAAGADFSRFRPEFIKYQVVVFNYDAPDERWPSDLKASFEEYIRNGGAFVAVHAADNAFPGWPAFNEMIGVGGWRGRTEQAGPMWYFENGKPVPDRAPGPAGSHGKRVPFQMIVRNPDHPIMKGLPQIWVHQGDELYARLRGPARNVTVLATAYSDPANRGSGRDEPLLMALSYGKGRIFHTTLGHDVNALSSVDFIATFQRGTEWAATGAVTQKVPPNFPTATAVSYRTDLAALDPAYKNGLDPLDATPQPSQVSPRPPQTAGPDVYPAQQVQAGQPLFSSRCGFCHGRDAAGGESGPDLTRSALVAGDVRGDKIGPVVRSGRIDKGMPAFDLGDADLSAIAAFIHERKADADRPGSRRRVDSDDLRTGDADAGKQYFNGAGGCSKCHQPDGDLAGIASRVQGLALLQRMLNPASPRSSGTAAKPPQVTVTLPSGQTTVGKLAYRDEFTIALTDSTGWYRSWPTGQVRFTVDSALDAHAAQLGKYTDDDIHNVLAYLQTLR